VAAFLLCNRDAFEFLFGGHSRSGARAAGLSCRLLGSGNQPYVFGLKAVLPEIVSYGFRFG
jgi:hypothetical protein